MLGSTGTADATSGVTELEDVGTVADEEPEPADAGVEDVERPFP